MKRLSITQTQPGILRIGASLQLAILLAGLTLATQLHAGNDRPVKQKAAPVYPEIAKRMRVGGLVKIAATVAPDGTVTATKVLSGSSLLSGAAEDAVHKWKFATASEESTVEVSVNFALAQ
jgi:TonB family protein